MTSERTRVGEGFAAHIKVADVWPFSGAVGDVSLTIGLDRVRGAKRICSLSSDVHLQSGRLYEALSAEVAHEWSVWLGIC